MARRGQGEGSVYQRARDGRWVGAVSLGRDASGRWRRRTVTGKTKREVLERMRALDRGPAGSAPTNLTMRELADRWLRDVVEPNLRRNTHASYETTWRVHLEPVLGHVVVRRLGPMQVEAALAALKGRPKKGSTAAQPASGRTRENAHLVLSRMLAQAVRWGLIDASPVERVERPRREEHELVAWSAEHARTFLRAALGDRLAALYVCAIATGMRQGELFGWQWADLDLETGAARVQRTLVEVAGKLELGPPKTRAGKRAMHLPAVARRALELHRQMMTLEGWPTTGDAHVFVDSEGGLLRKSNVRRRNFEPLLARAEVPRITFQALRHTCATLLLSMRAHPKVVAERLGHSDTTITLDVYSHVLPGLQEEASSLIDSALAPRPTRSEG